MFPTSTTVLLLRPTQSATLFTQQLGRGLRRAQGKSNLTVLDLIGQQHREFRFEDRLRAILDPRRGPILSRSSRSSRSCRPAAPSIWIARAGRSSSRTCGRRSGARAGPRSSPICGRSRTASASASSSIEHDHRLEDVYRSGRSWTQLRRDAGHTAPASSDTEFERQTLRALARLTHIDDPERIEFYRGMLLESDPPSAGSVDERLRRLLTMLAWDLGSGSGPYSSLDDYYLALWLEEAARRELVELFDATRCSFDHSQPSVGVAARGAPGASRPIHPKRRPGGASGRRRRQAATVEGRIISTSDGRCDVFFVDLQKAERDYSPTTMYQDYAINRELFHWESQSTQTPQQPRVRRWIEHQQRGGSILLFVRDKKRSSSGTQPFTFLGPVTYVDHRGERPVAFTWRLPVPMPEELFEVARSVAAA